jgi:hypothetical protein
LLPSTSLYATFIFNWHHMRMPNTGNHCPNRSRTRAAYFALDQVVMVFSIAFKY